jgi:competence protein CoiA
MQLYGLDQSGPILAEEASRGKNYLCPECLAPIRVRGGPHRQHHFFHIRSNIQCTQHQKSLPHIQAQLALKNCLPEAGLEKPFPTIGRIADVAWEEKKMIFEIQCSPISLEEVQNRNRDYASLGWKVIWILHDNRYNKRKLTPVEIFLRQNGCYFTDIDSSGNGIFYDQFEVLNRFFRAFRGPKLSVNPATFTGSLADRLSKLSPSDPSLLRMQALEERFGAQPPPKTSHVKRFYNALFRLMLEKLCN